MNGCQLDDVLFASHLHEVQREIDAALAALGFDALVIAAGRELPVFLDDQHYPFRANPWFSWLVPATAAPGSLLHCAPGRPPRLLFVSPEDFWHSPPEVPDEPWTELVAVEPVPDSSTAVSRTTSIHGNVAWIGEENPPVARWQANPPALLARLEQARCRKSPYELSCLRAASRSAAAGHLAAEQAFRRGASEYDIQLAFLAAARQAENTLPYPPIVALNEHAAVLHYQRRDTQPPAHALSLLIDAGTSCHDYASDITRTWAAAPGLFATLVDRMHDLQQELCRQVAPGADWRELHLNAHRLVAQLLNEHGVIRMAPDNAVASGVSAVFLPHGLGHLLGLQVHDVGGFRPAADAEPIPRPPGHPALRLTRRLEAGMVVTVEPGLYFIDSLLARLRSGPHAGAVNWDLVERLRPCGGIRIEDNVMVTATGGENLTRVAFADAAG